MEFQEEINQNSYSNTVISSENTQFSLPSIVRFVLPMTKTILSNGKLLDKIFLDSIVAVQASLPADKASNITILKSTIQRKKGNLKAISYFTGYFQIRSPDCSYPGHNSQWPNNSTLFH